MIQLPEQRIVNSCINYINNKFYDNGIVRNLNYNETIDAADKLRGYHIGKYIIAKIWHNNVYHIVFVGPNYILYECSYNPMYPINEQIDNPCFKKLDII